MEMLCGVSGVCLGESPVGRAPTSSVSYHAWISRSCSSPAASARVSSEPCAGGHRNVAMVISDPHVTERMNFIICTPQTASACAGEMRFAIRSLYLM